MNVPRTLVLAPLAGLAILAAACGKPSADPALRVQTLEGEVASLGDYAGQVVFLNFWATWCGPCVQEMPSIQRLHDAYGEEVVFLLASNENASTVRSFAAKNGYTMPLHTLTNSGVPASFNVSAIPATFIIDGTGAVRMHHVGAREWDDPEVTELLNSLL
jgi:thiol-disulfide isomerase/thioredoxin